MFIVKYSDDHGIKVNVLNHHDIKV